MHCNLEMEPHIDLPYHPEEKNVDTNYGNIGHICPFRPRNLSVSPEYLETLFLPLQNLGKSADKNLRSRIFKRVAYLNFRASHTFTHAKGMVDITSKNINERFAVASCTMELPADVCAAIFDPLISLNDKGDIIGTAKIAGVMGAKRTSDLIPLCHPIALSQVTVQIEKETATSLRIRGSAKCVGPTGVEMEALTAVSIAALTVYDMTKSALKGDPKKSIVISNIHLEYKSIDQSTLLGEGTYGRVFKGLDTETNLPVAIKRAKVEIRSASGGIHFTTIREIKVMRRLDHPNLMNLVDIFNEKDEAVVSLVMPFMETDLGSIFSDRSVIFTMAHVKGITAQILAGLHYMHSHWFVHRDLKPANVFVDTISGTCKIGDFGFARTFATPHSGIHNRRRPFGGAMTPLVVTQWYRAPELFFGSVYYGPGVDIWAAGCIVCEMLPRAKSNRHPLFDASSDVEQLGKIFQLMGTPSESLWPMAKVLPKFLLFTHLPPPSLPWPETLFPGSCAAAAGTADFIQSLLMVDPADRIQATEALQSEYLTQTLPAPSSNRLLASLFKTRMIKTATTRSDMG